MDSESILKTAKERMGKSANHLKEELGGLRTGKAAPSLLEQVKVDAYGSKMILRDLASINAPDSRLLTVQVWDQANLQPVEKAIRDAGLGLNPALEGNLIRVPVPPLSEERRKEMTKLVTERSEAAKVAIRQIRREAIEELEKGEKRKELSEDDKKRLEDQVQKATEDFNKQVEEMAKAKEAEIMQI